jgi:peptide/nickel transport system substrate-binding protein
VLERKESYWDVDSYPIKTIDIRNVADGSPRVAALIAGDIQFTRSDDATIITSLANTPSAEVLTSDGQYLTYVNYCKNRAPFNDPNVRRAFSAAIDRSALVEGVTAGRGKPAFQAWAEGSPNFNPDAVSAYDVDEARSLLKGKEVEVDMSFLPVIPGHERLGEILQAQLAEVGINVNLKPNENPDDAFRESNDAVLMASSLQGVQRVRQLGRDSVSNLCGYSSPELDTLTRKIATLDPESDEANQAWHDVATLIHDDELLSVLFFRPTVTAFSKDKVNSMSFSTPQTDFRFVYAK